MANWFTNQKAKRLMTDMPIEHDMHRDGPKNMNKGYGQEVPGGPPMYDTDEGGPPMHDEFTRKNNIKHDGPKMYIPGKPPNPKVKTKTKTKPVANTSNENTAVTDIDKKNAD